jgi:hypothetical protein
LTSLRVRDTLFARTNMAVLQGKKQTDLEKRMKMLQNQLYGKQEDKSLTHSNQPINEARMSLNTDNSDQLRTSIRTENHSDIAFLKSDLTKIIILSSLAFGAEAVLYFSKIHQYIKFF